MAAKGEVKVTGGFSGNVTGVTVTYQAGSIPHATIDLFSEGGGSFSSIESSKRRDVSISISCKVHAGGNSVDRNLKFEGVLDGMSLASTVGRSHFQVVAKGKAQCLLELTVLTPGLYPSSVNVYKMPDFSVGVKDDMVESWGIFDPDGSLPYKKDPITFYTELIKKVLEVQQGNFSGMLGTEPLMNNSEPFQKIFSDGRYSNAVSKAKSLFGNIDISAVVGGGAAPAGTPKIFSSIQKMLMNGPNVLLENYMNFLAQMGCTMIFGNSKLWAVPMNTVVKPNGGSPKGGGQLQSSPNAAGPADCIAYNYNDVGYRDIACVIVNGNDLAGGVNIGSTAFTRDHLCHYCDESGTSKASGVLVINNHPWMAAFPESPEASDAKETKEKLDQTESMCPKKGSFSDGQKTGSSAAQDTEKKKEKVKTSAEEVLQNYAQTKFLQARYGDRQGTITMDFNPMWVPGTGGTLYIREIQTTLSFYVTSVSHHIDVSPPASGTAITTVSFSCGRAGSGPEGAGSDKFLGYNGGKEKGVQTSFLGDIGAI